MKHLSCLISVLYVFTSTAQAMPAFASRSEVVGGDYDNSQALPIQNAVAKQADMNKAKIEYIASEREKNASAPKDDLPVLLNQAGIDALIQDYDVIAVANKATQRLVVYRYQIIDGKRVAVPEKEIVNGKSVIRKMKISTGRERWKCEAKKDANNQPTGEYEAQWTGTPTGYYNPYYLDPDHHSHSYDDSNMYKAVFFNGGIATHETDEKSLLGQAASHGCIRMGSKDSEDLFKWVLQTGGPVPKFTGECPSQDLIENPDDKEICQLDADRRAKKWNEIATSAISEGNQENRGPYAERPQIPNINPDRTVNAARPTKSGYKALYVVQCVDASGAPCPKSTLPDRDPLKKKDCSKAGEPVQPALAQKQMPPAAHSAPKLSNIPLVGGLFDAIGTALSPQRQAPQAKPYVAKPAPRAKYIAPSASVPAKKTPTPRATTINDSAEETYIPAGDESL